MKKTRTANLHHLYHEPLPENLKLTPKVEVDNVHQRQTTDVYEHALTITAWQQIYDQLHPGKFHGEFTEILLDDIQVFREYTGLALRQSCLVWPNSFWFGIPATRGEQGFIGSQCLGSAEIATRPGGTEFELSTPDDYTILGVVLSEDVITRQANFLHNPDRVPLKNRTLRPIHRLPRRHNFFLPGYLLLSAPPADKMFPTACHFRLPA